MLIRFLLKWNKIFNTILKLLSRFLLHNLKKYDEDYFSGKVKNLL